MAAAITKRNIAAICFKNAEKLPNPILYYRAFLGGIMCTEIAKQIPVEKIIIISSINIPVNCHSG